MEHRWGLRTAVDEVVHVWAPSHVGSSGRLTNVSISGALIRSSLPIQLWSRVKLRLAASKDPVRKTHTMAEAQVVRVEPGGFAIEWSEFAPPLARALIRDARVKNLAQRDVASTKGPSSAPERESGGSAEAVDSKSAHLLLPRRADLGPSS
jgi:PilZ domain